MPGTPLMKEQQYRDSRGPEHYAAMHEYARTHDPSQLVYQGIRLMFTPVAMLGFRLRAAGRMNVPAEGGVILAINHFSFLDHFFAAAPIGREFRFMAKSQMLKGPHGFVMHRGGVFPVSRGHGDDAGLVTAGILLEKGQIVTMYPEGGRSRTGVISRTAKYGVGRLALEAGVPVVPVAINGTQHLREWRRGRIVPAPVHVQYGRPLFFGHYPQASRKAQQEVADCVLTAIRIQHEQMMLAL